MEIPATSKLRNKQYSVPEIVKVASLPSTPRFVIAYFGYCDYSLVFIITSSEMFTRSFTWIPGVNCSSWVAVRHPPVCLYFPLPSISEMKWQRVYQRVHRSFIICLDVFHCILRHFMNWLSPQNSAPSLDRRSKRSWILALPFFKSLGIPPTLLSRRSVRHSLLIRDMWGISRITRSNCPILFQP